MKVFRAVLQIERSTRFGLRFKGLAVKVRYLSLVEVVAEGFRVQFRDVNVI